LQEVWKYYEVLFPPSGFLVTLRKIPL